MASGIRAPMRGETVFGTREVGNDYLADTGVLQLFGNVKDLR